MATSTLVVELCIRMRLADYPGSGTAMNQLAKMLSCMLKKQPSNDKAAVILPHSTWQQCCSQTIQCKIQKQQSNVCTDHSGHLELAYCISDMALYILHDILN